MSSCSNSQTSEASNSGQETAQQKDKQIDFENAYIVDVRTPQEFASGHYEGAINIPLNTVEAHLDEFEGKEQIVVYCRSGARSGNAKMILENAGYSNVINGINQSNLEKLEDKQK
ncbi:hypothetical protein CW751_07065 [Brumimicrobium salinarum]|uniref:Rhodanese domain-containing protein n=2 Tax=Brumimicrobium salinarum TaxID=2058658 RepID=A0A2I0R388_9FLAO|nr:hypothetical protein CW751_07065 [Brumimicrobium salinarum]